MFPASSHESLKLEILADRLTLGLPGEREEPDRHELARRLLERHPVLAERGAREIVDEVVGEYPGTLRGLEALGDKFIRLASGQPRMAGEVGLRHARRLVDEDLLLASWAGRRTTFEPSLLAADLIQPDLDEDLASMLEKPLAETHIHLWGAGPPIGVWLPAMLGLVSIHELARVAAGGDVDEGGDPRTWRDLTVAWTLRLLEAAVLRLWLAAALRCWTAGSAFRRIDGLPRKDPGSVPPRDRLAELVRCHRGRLKALGYARGAAGECPPVVGCPIWIAPGHELPYRDPLCQAVELDLGVSRPVECLALGERYLLASGLRFTHSTRDQARRRFFELRLLRYVRIKNAFQRIFLHHPGTRGLERFLRQFSRRRPSPEPLDSRAREVWKLALERYQTRIVVLRWLAATSRRAANTVLPSAPPATPALARALALQHSQLERLERKLELRVSPDLGPRLRRFIHARLQGLRDALLAFDRLPGPGSEPGRAHALPRFRVGLVYHLQKRARTSWRVYEETSRKLATLLHDRPELRHFVIGVDAAGDEIAAPPTRFARAFRGARAAARQPVRTSRHPELPIQLGYTFHVGEDFRDLLTGLRQIALAVEVLGLQAGDRLGHALALGLDPETWYGANITTYPRAADHLIDLVWAYYRLRDCMTEEGRRAREYLLEGKGITEFQAAVDDFESWLAGWRQPAETGGSLNEREIYNRLRHRLGSSGKLSRTQPQDKLVEIPSDENRTRTVRLLQDLVAADLARRGIVVEANPTSNLLIAQLSDYGQHPIFRFHPVNSTGERLQITVSTDDPGMVQTSLGEEYASLLESGIAADQHGRAEILSWLDRLRDDSWRCCFIRGPSISGQEYLDYILTMSR